MKNCNRKTAVAGLIALALLAISALTPTMAASSSGAPSPKAPAGESSVPNHQDLIDKRIRELHDQLSITDQQSQQWNGFTQTMRDNARNIGKAFRDRAKKLPSLNADQAMRSYAALAQLHADNMQRLAVAFSALYATLSDEQKKMADSLYRNEHPKRHAATQKPKPAPKPDAALAPGPSSD
jgi:LTXXQ motif family protein